MLEMWTKEGNKKKGGSSMEVDEVGKVHENKSKSTQDFARQDKTLQRGHREEGGESKAEMP